MTDTDQRAFAETVFERYQRREAEISDALKQENARREAAVKNMYRLKRHQNAKSKQAGISPGPGFEAGQQFTNAR